MGVQMFGMNHSNLHFSDFIRGNKFHTAQLQSSLIFMCV